MRSEERRLVLARERGREAVESLAREACLTTMPLICRPPPPVEPFAYGDLVPLGFLLRAVNVDAYGAPAVSRDLEDLLRGRRQGLLWPYHTGTLVTCIDSALVLQEFRDPAGVEALEIFVDGRRAASIPFYSALTIPRERCPAGLLARLMLGERRGQLAWLEGAVRRHFVHRRAPYDQHGPSCGALPYATRSSRRA